MPRPPRPEGGGCPQLAPSSTTRKVAPQHRRLSALAAREGRRRKPPAPSAEDPVMPVPANLVAPPLLALLLAALQLPAGPTAPQAPTQISPAAARNVRFGLPGPASADPQGRERYLIARPQ